MLTDIFVKASSSDKRPEDVQLAILLNIAGDDAMTVYITHSPLTYSCIMPNEQNVFSPPELIIRPEEVLGSLA